jgi:oligopeptidase A
MTADTATTSNPLLATDFLIPFDQIRAGHIEPGIRQAVAEAEAQLDSLAQGDTPLTWDATVAAFDALTDRLGRVVTVARHLNSVNSTPELRDAFNAALPVFSGFYAGLADNQPLWRKLSAYAASREAATLGPVRRRRLDKLIRDFQRMGADLPDAERQRVRELRIRLDALQTKFGENVLDSTGEFELLVSDPAELAGLPESALQAARASAQAKGQEGWRFTLHQPSVVPVLQYAENRELRKKIHQAFHNRGATSGSDNRPVMLEILQVRRELARLLGFSDFADYRLEVNMVGSGSAAQAFVEDLYQRTAPRWQQELADMAEFARNELDLDPVEAWDESFVVEKLRKQRFDLDAEELRPYFPRAQVMQGLFDLCTRLFGVSVSEVANERVWHPDVRFYEIHDADGTHLASFYADWHPRDGKRAGAWMNSFITGGPRPDGSFAPHLGLIVGNLTEPIDGQEALFTHREVQTVFHEFGHLLHHSLSQVTEPALAGTNVLWDWVELPSQIMENWTFEREALDLFAQHHETGARIPEELFGKLIAARTFAGAYAQMRQLAFGTVDLALHIDFDPHAGEDITAFGNAVRKDFAARPEMVADAMLCAFSHIFAGGYAAGYYSYKWSEVLDADAFTRFQDEGIFNPETGMAFRRAVLERGDSADPNDLYQEFMGRGPAVEALISRNLG